jgi:hypothetical protein
VYYVGVIYVYYGWVIDVYYVWAIDVYYVWVIDVYCVWAIDVYWSLVIDVYYVWVIYVYYVWVIYVVLIDLCMSACFICDFAFELADFQETLYEVHAIWGHLVVILLILLSPNTSCMAVWAFKVEKEQPYAWYVLGDEFYGMLKDEC